MNFDSNQSNRNLNEILIILALIASPFTQIRMGFIGITEVLLFFLFIRVVLVKSNRVKLQARRHFVFTRFWIFFMIISTLGTGYNYIMLGHSSGTLNTLAIDASSYIVALFVSFSIETLIYSNESFNIWNILKKTYIYSSLVLLVLYMISIFFGDLFGVPLMYYNSFRPFASNIHHISMSLAPLPFLGLKLVSMEKKKVLKIPYLVLIISNIVIANATGSVKVMLGLIASFLIYIIVFSFKRLRNTRHRLLFTLFVLFFLTSVFSIYIEPIVNLSSDFFIEEDIGGARLFLWSNSIQKIAESPFVGYGPGAHATYFSGSYSDAHQTLLTVGLQAGITGILLYIMLHLKIISNICKDPYIIASYTGILLYALGGDILRRLPMWIFLILFHYFLNNKHETITK